MARTLERSVRFVEPGRYILNMLLFLTAAGAVVFYLSPWSPQPTTLLVDAFNANRALNGLIIFVLVFGIIYYLRAAGVVQPAIRWAEAFRDDARLPRAPVLLGAMARVLIVPDPDSATRRDRRRSAITPEETRAVLDSIGTRMDESRDTGRYIGNLLVFLGLLGTFWGLIATVNGVAAVIGDLASSGGEAEDAITQLIANLREPLSGMGVAFSSSLFGLSGSLVLGFLDLQASQAHGQFYTDIEDWLTGMTEARSPSTAPRSSLSGAEDGFTSLEAALGANTEALIKAQAGQIAELKDEIRALNRTLIRGSKE